MMNDKRRSLERIGLLGMHTGLIGCTGPATFSGPDKPKPPESQWRFEADPFALGVCSGSPRHDAMVIWTRLMGAARSPQPAMLQAPALAVAYEIASDEAFSNVVQRGVASAWPQRAHAVHVDVVGLSASTRYWYRFIVGQGTQRVVSPSGRFVTLPAPGVIPSSFKLAYASCQQFEQGYFGAYRRMREEQPDLVVFLGDYIYESSWGRSLVRSHAAPEAVSLDDYRARYALYRSDLNLQAMHAWCPWLVTWDDHEVVNDYANLQDGKLSTDFVNRRAAGYRAFFEHMPLRMMAQLDENGRWQGRFVQWAHVQVYESVDVGALVRIHLLDDRQYRSVQACPVPGRGGSRMVENCDALRDPARTMLGAEQEAWFGRQTRSARSQFNVIAQQTLFAYTDSQPGPGERFWTDGWDGYQAARERLIDTLVSGRAANPVWLGGDVHTHWVAEIPERFHRAGSPQVGVEFCGTSITSQGGPQARFEATLQENPHIRHVDSRMRGYGLVTLSRDRLITQLRGVNEKLPDPPRVDQAQFRWQGQGHVLERET